MKNKIIISCDKAIPFALDSEADQKKMLSEMVELVRQNNGDQLAAFVQYNQKRAERQKAKLTVQHLAACRVQGSGPPAVPLSVEYVPKRNRNSTYLPPLLWRLYAVKTLSGV